MNIEWATGVFEGEGWIKKDKRKQATFDLGINMTDADVLHRIKETFFNYGSVYETKSRPQHKQMYRWSVTKKAHVKDILLAMLPLLGMRRAYQALNALDDIEAR